MIWKIKKKWHGLLEEHKIIGQSGVMTIKLFPSPLHDCWKYFIWIFKLILTTSFQVKPKIKLAWPTWIWKPYCLWDWSVNRPLLGHISWKWWAFESLSPDNANKLDSGIITVVDVRQDDLRLWSLYLQS